MDPAAFEVGVAALLHQHAGDRGRAQVAALREATERAQTGLRRPWSRVVWILAFASAALALASIGLIPANRHVPEAGFSLMWTVARNDSREPCLASLTAISHKF